MTCRALPLFALFGCSASSPPRMKVDVAAVNAIVPAEMRASLVFEQRDVVVTVDGVKTTYAIAVPAGVLVMPWFRSTTSNQTSVLGDLDDVRLTVGSICDGTCGVRDWEAVVDELLAPEAAGKVADQTQVGRRLFTSKQTEPVPKTIITLATWVAGGDRFQICRFELGDAVAAAAPAFVKACESMRSDRALRVVSTAKPPPNYVDVPSHPELEIVAPGMKAITVNQPGMGIFENASITFAVERADEGLLDVATYQDQLRTQGATPLTDRPTDGGWIVTYQADPVVATGAATHGVQVRRKIGDAVYKCQGIVREQDLDTVIAACTSIRLANGPR